MNRLPTYKYIPEGKNTRILFIKSIKIIFQKVMMYIILIVLWTNVYLFNVLIYKILALHQFHEFIYTTIMEVSLLLCNHNH